MRRKLRQCPAEHGLLPAHASAAKLRPQPRSPARQCRRAHRPGAARVQWRRVQVEVRVQRQARRSAWERPPKLCRCPTAHVAHAAVPRSEHRREDCRLPAVARAAKQLSVHRQVYKATDAALEGQARAARVLLGERAARTCQALVGAERRMAQRHQHTALCFFHQKAWSKCEWLLANVLDFER